MQRIYISYCTERHGRLYGMLWTLRSKKTCVSWFQLAFHWVHRKKKKKTNATRSVEAPSTASCRWNEEGMGPFSCCYVRWNWNPANHQWNNSLHKHQIIYWMVADNHLLPLWLGSVAVGGGGGPLRYNSSMKVFITSSRSSSRHSRSMYLLSFSRKAMISFIFSGLVFRAERVLNERIIT